VIVDNPRVDLPTVMKAKTNSVVGLTSGIEGLFKKNGVVYEKGTGKILSPNQVEVERLDGSKTVVNTKFVFTTFFFSFFLKGIFFSSKSRIVRCK
jgi:dihydrolipoamide dehydrogenase